LNKRVISQIKSAATALSQHDIHLCM